MSRRLAQQPSKDITLPLTQRPRLSTTRMPLPSSSENWCMRPRQRGLRSGDSPPAQQADRRLTQEATPAGLWLNFIVRGTPATPSGSAATMRRSPSSTRISTVTRAWPRSSSRSARAPGPRPGRPDRPGWPCGGTQGQPSRQNGSFSPARTGAGRARSRARRPGNPRCSRTPPARPGCRSWCTRSGPPC